MIMKKFIVGFFMVLVCLLALPENSRAQVLDEVTIKARLAELRKEISRLEKLIAEQDKPTAPAPYSTYTYRDAAAGLSVSYRADTKFSVKKTAGLADSLKFSPGKVIDWEFHQGNKKAGSIAVLDGTMYQLINASIGFIDFIATAANFYPDFAAGAETNLSLKTSPGFKERDGFSYKTISFSEGQASDGSIIGFRPFISRGAEGGLVVSASWGNNLDQLDQASVSVMGLMPDSSYTFTGDVYFKNEASAKAFFNSLTSNLDYSETSLLNLLNESPVEAEAVSR